MKRFPGTFILTAAAIGVLAGPVGAQTTVDGDAYAARFHEQIRPALVAVTSALGRRGTFYGSGTIVHPDGYILTSTLVVPPGAENIRVQLANGVFRSAELVLSRPEREFSIIKMDGKGFSYLGLGDSDRLGLGDQVYTVGNAHQVMTREDKIVLCGGAISGRYNLAKRSGSKTSLEKNEDWNGDNQSNYSGEILESTAAINPGVDGGPLLDARGRVVGLISLGYSRQRFLGAAIPVNQIRGDLEGGQNVGNGLGITVHAAKGGLEIVSVLAGSPAAKAGLKKDDTIIGLPGDQAATLETWRAATEAIKSGDTIELNMRRGPWTRRMTLTCGDQDGSLDIEWPAGPAFDVDPTFDALGRVYRKALAKVEKSVVQLRVQRKAAAARQPRGNNPLRRQPQAANNTRPTGGTSGVIVEADGLILTSFYNVEGAERITVTLASGAEHGAKVVGSSRAMDLALLKIEAENLPVPTFAKTQDLAKGTLIGVVGRGVGAPTLTTGIISQLGRQRGACYQVDAIMNYGNTGGALINTKGEVIGIGAFIGHRFRWGISSGVGFAVTSKKVFEVLDELKEGKRVDATPIFGVQSRNRSLTIASVREGSSAARAGVLAGDRIISVNGRALKGWGDLVQVIRTRVHGDDLVIIVEREGEQVTLRGKM